MLKTIRVILAAIFMIALTLLFLDFTGLLNSYLGWMAKLQLVPAILATNVIVVVALLIITAIIGRIYCSIICPLGICQDISSFCADKRKKNRFLFSQPKKLTQYIRYSILAVFVVAIILRISLISTLLEPYSAFGRMVTNLLSPFYLIGNNLMALFAEKMDSYAFYSVDIWLKSLATLIVALITFFIIGIMSWKNGRIYCNTICPVGTALGLLSRKSLFRPQIDASQCVSCGICEKSCKASCIDSKNKVIDSQRCVVCFNCVERCPKKGVKFMKKTITDINDSSRRNIIAGIGLFIFSFFTKKMKAYDFDGGLAELENKKAPTRLQNIIPPGADNLRSFSRKCTACQLCVSSCPNNVLRPATNLQNFMQPQLSFERGFCTPNCVTCSNVCPTGAINPISVEEKSAIQIGYAVWKSDLCVINTDNVNCNLCAHTCPTGAITMIQKNENTRMPMMPVIDIHRCIGCGACEHRCPARPYSAIYVEGIDTHRNV